MSADEWIVRAFSQTLQNASPAGLAYEAGSEDKLWTHKPLDLHQPSRKCMDATTHDRHNLSRENHSSFSAQLKAFIPVIMMLVTVRHSQLLPRTQACTTRFAHQMKVMQEATWMSAQSSQSPQLQGAHKMETPPQESLYALCRDALCGESTLLNGLSVSVSASKFISHLLTSFATFSGVGIRSQEANSCGDRQDLLPPWPGAHALTTPLGVLSLHMMKLDSASAVSCLWRVFVRTLVVDFCEDLTRFGTCFNKEEHRRISGLSCFCNSVPTTPHALWMQGMNDCIRDMINANDFMEWTLAESHWEAAELGLTRLDKMDTLKTIEEECGIDMGEDGLTGEGARLSGDVADMITHMLNMLLTSTSGANITASGMALPRLSTDALPEGTACRQDNSAVHDPGLIWQPTGHDPSGAQELPSCQQGWEVGNRPC